MVQGMKITQWSQEELRTSIKWDRNYHDTDTNKSWPSEQVVEGDERQSDLAYWVSKQTIL